MKNQGKKYTKQERQKYNEKLHADKKRQEKKDQNKVVRFISLTIKNSYRSNRELKKDIKKCLVKWSKWSSTLIQTMMNENK